MKEFKFVYFEGGEEKPVGLADVDKATLKLDSAGGELALRRSDGLPTRIEGEQVMAIIRLLGEMPQYRWKRVDAIEVSTPT